MSLRKDAHRFRAWVWASAIDVIVLLAIVSGQPACAVAPFNGIVEGSLPSECKGDAASTSVKRSSNVPSNAGLLLFDEEKLIKETLLALRKGQPERKDVLDKIEKMLTPGKEQELFQAIADARTKYAPHEDDFLKIAERSDYATAKDVMLERARPAQLKYLAAIKNFSNSGGEEQPGRRGANAAYKTPYDVSHRVLARLRGGWAWL